MHCDVAEKPNQEDYVHLIIDRLGVRLRKACKDIDEKDDGHLIHNVQLEQEWLLKRPEVDQVPRLAHRDQNHHGKLHEEQLLRHDCQKDEDEAPQDEDDWVGQTRALLGTKPFKKRAILDSKRSFGPIGEALAVEDQNKDREEHQEDGKYDLCDIVDNVECRAPVQLSLAPLLLEVEDYANGDVQAAFDQVADEQIAVKRVGQAYVFFGEPF